jgi:hypothetical protein
MCRRSRARPLQGVYGRPTAPIDGTKLTKVNAFRLKFADSPGAGTGQSLVRSEQRFSRCRMDLATLAYTVGVEGRRGRAVADRLGGPSAWHRRGINGLFRSAGCGEAKLAGRTVRCHEFGRRSVMAGKARTRPSWKRNTARYQEQVAPAKTREGQENLQKKNRYANRGG